MVILLIVLAAAAAGAAIVALSPRDYATVRFHMDTYISYDVRCLMPRKAVERMDAAVRECEELFDRFDPSSEIAAVNANAGSPVKVSEQTYRLIEEAVRLSAQTEGYFDPTVGALSDLWGFGSEPHIPAQDEVAGALSAVGYEKVVLSEDGSGFYICAGEGQKLDLGAIAKGYALGKVREAAEKAHCSNGIISFGGNVLLLGEGKHSGGYRVGIRCPDENSNSSAVAVVLKDTVLSTSGSYERFFYEDGVRYCHIIDPFTGSCAETDLRSVTVICEDPVLADCLSTAYFVMGIDRTLDALASGEITGVAIDRYGIIYISEDLADLIVEGSVAEGYELEVVG